jgi:pimeloyl-ACP methyl ester carboxylesterase
MLIEKKISLRNSVTLNVKYSQTIHTEAVLFIHFGGGTLHMWDGVLPHFEKDFTVIAPDVRGHGKSDKPKSGYHIDDMADDLILLLEQLGIEKYHIVGSSMGAEIGLSLAARYPNSVSSLVCEGALYNEFGEFGLFSGSQADIDAEKEKLTAKLAERVVPEFATPMDYIEKMKEPLVKAGLWNDYFLTYFQSTLVKTEKGTFISHYQNDVRSEYMQRYWDMRFEEYYKRIQCPVLFLPSQEESHNEKVMQIVAEFAKLVEQHEISYIEDSNHAFVWMQFPQLASEIVLEFISSK